MQHKIRAALAVLAVAGLGLGLASAATASGAAAASDTSFQTPVRGGLLLNALHWGGTGSKAATLNGTSVNGVGVVNDPISVWAPSSASVASDFTLVAITFETFNGNVLTPANAPATCTNSGGCSLIEYTPGGKPTGLCVSTVTDVKGAFARLRNCAFDQTGTTSPSTNTAMTATVPADNQWQDFAQVAAGDGLFQLEAVLEPPLGPYVLNDAQFGGNGSQVISWTPEMSENQLWEQVPAS